LAGDTVLYDKSGHVATVTLNRPDAGNAYSTAMIKELTEVWTDFKNDEEMWVSIVTGAGDKAFSLGRDRTHLPEGVDNVPPPYRPSLGERDEGVRFLTPKHFQCWKPMIVAVNGDAVGAAFHFICDGDIVICSENARFWDEHTIHGSTVVWEPIQLARKVPYEIAMRMMLMGRAEKLDAQRAYQVGLVSEVLPLPELIPAARKIADTICENDIYASIGTVEAVYKGQELGMLQGIHQGLLIRQLQNYKRALATGASAKGGD
jgi:enoyl-CoA hydratase/carnithine racemase